MLEDMPITSRIVTSLLADAFFTENSVAVKGSQSDMGIAVLRADLIRSL